MLTVSFPMTEKEIAAEDADIAKMEALRIAHVLLPKPRVERFELPESGNYIVFPLAEIKKAGKANLRTVKRAGAETIE
jgi:hypothetical protein